MSAEITVRLAESRDANVLTAFNRAMALETEGKVLLPAVVARGVRRLFEKADLGFYVVAERDGDVVGSLMITTEWSDWRNGSFWWVQSVYVRPDYRRRGIYRRLYAFVRDLAAGNAEVCGFRLYVERDNPTARQAYETLGMEETAYRLYEDLKDGIEYYQKPS